MDDRPNRVCRTACDAPASRRNVLRGAGGLALASLLGGAAARVATAQDDPLPSWNDGPRKQAILAFVAAATDEDGNDFVPPAERIATFDQDGTLWVEHPIYTQAVFALDRIKALAPEHPDWASKEPFAAILSGDQAAIEKFNEEDWEQVLAETHTGMSVADFLTVAAEWMATAKTRTSTTFTAN